MNAGEKQADGASETVTTPLVHVSEFFRAFGQGRRNTLWEMAARIFDVEPDLERVVETVYYGDHSEYPNAIAAILWEGLWMGTRDEAETASLRSDLMREALAQTAGDWDLEELSDEVDAHMDERDRDEDLYMEFQAWRRANHPPTRPVLERTSERGEAGHRIAATARDVVGQDRAGEEEQEQDEPAHPSEENM